MKIERLSKVKGYRIFTDFTWPADLPNFSRYNLIYGWNGTGKSTLSNLFSHLESKRNVMQGEVDFQIDGSVIKGQSLDSSLVPDTRVFNKNTVDRSMFETHTKEFAPVFYLGEESATKQKLIEDLVSKREVVIEKSLKAKESESLSSKTLDDFCKNKAQEVKSLLTSAGSGSFNNYNKSHFAAKAERLLAGNPPPYCLLPETYKEYLSRKEGQALQEIKLPNIAMPDFEKIYSQTKELLQRSILSNTISALKENPEIASWVQHGLGLHGSDDPDVHCHFCANIIKPERIVSLQEHFNDQLTEFQREIDVEIRRLKKAKNEVAEISLPVEAQFYPHLRSKFSNKLVLFSSSKYAIDVFFGALILALQEKREQPFKDINLQSFLSIAGSTKEEKSVLRKVLETLGDVAQMLGIVFGLNSLNDIKELIIEHNDFTKDFKEKVEKSKSILEAHIVSMSLLGYEAKREAIQAAEEDCVQLRAELDELNHEIRILEQEVREFVRPATELNQEMASYLGRDELQFEVKDSGYIVSRNGYPAADLSEGERTAIAFLYFLKTLQDTSFDKARGIVVIDDPISSLDANSLYSAYAFMKIKTRDVNQLFVLTHNFTFFRHVRKWFFSEPKLPAIQNHQGSSDYRKAARFYMLASTKEVDVRGTRIQQMDPLLLDYESEYQYLFKLVYDFVESEDDVQLETYYGLPNCARRLLESFLTFKMPNFSAGSIEKKLDEVEFDSTRKTRILRFLHVQSHNDQIGAPEHDLSLLSETPAVLKDLMDLIREVDEGHYNGMKSFSEY